MGQEKPFDMQGFCDDIIYAAQLAKFSAELFHIFARRGTTTTTSNDDDDDSDATLAIPTKNIYIPFI